MDYSQLKNALSNGPLISGTSESDGLHLRELVWIECLKALIENTKDDQTEAKRSGSTAHSDRIIAKNVQTACKYATQFMNARTFFDNCIAAPFAINTLDDDPDPASTPGYPGTVPLNEYGYDTPFFSWEFDYALDRYKVTVFVDQSIFPVEYGCGWEYSEIQLRINPSCAGPTVQTSYFQLQSNADEPDVPNAYAFTNPPNEDISKGMDQYLSYPTQADLDADTNGTIRCPNGTGISTVDGFSFFINTYDYNQEDWSNRTAVIQDTGIVPPIPIPSSGGLIPGCTYNIYLRYKCGNIEGVPTGSYVFTPYNITIPASPPYPPIPI